ncbi:MAG: hypothetical protein ABIN91_20810 [Mucilaginibacter sp.]|uniref:hypothetical protein n=1 Tax=Mucilaginibacter sp. TaxID=1882438 RepID=UPI0032657C46
MKTKYYIALVPLFGISVLGINAKAQSKTHVIQRAPKVITIDGTVAEWKDSAPKFDATNKLGYTVANDDNYLYISAFTKDLLTERKILLGGITISINTADKKNKAYQLTYPAPGTFLKSNPADTIKTINIKTSGFNGGDAEVNATANTQGFKAALKFDDYSNLGYEIAIPLKQLGLVAGTTNQIKMNICVNGVESLATISEPQIVIEDHAYLQEVRGYRPNFDPSYKGTIAEARMPTPHVELPGKGPEITVSHDFDLKVALATN